MAALHTIALLTTSTLDLSEVLELIYERIAHLMKLDTFYIALYDEQQQKLNFEIFAEKGERFDTFSKQAAEMGLSGWIIQSRKPLLIRNMAKATPPVAPGVAGEPIPPELCYLGVPIMKKDKVIGVVPVQGFQPYTYDEEDQHFPIAIADQTAIAIENARLFEQTESALGALHASEERFALAVQGANDGIWDWDIQKNSLYWSPRMKALLGYADEELNVEFDTLDAVLHPDDKERTKATMEARLKDGRLYNVDHRLRTKSGEYRWFHAREQVVIDEAGNPVRMIGSTADVTNRKQAEERLHAALQGIIEALGQTTETRDLYTSSHQKRVTQLACAIAKEMRLSEERVEGIRVAGLLHDIGKLAIPAEILSKPNELSEMEYGLFEAHPQVAYNILKSIEFPWPVAQIVLQHHERMDGSGYPQRLKGEEFMLEARILAVADVVEAMSSHRSYRPALGVDKVLEEIVQKKGKLYDPEVVDACVCLFDEKGFEFETQRLTSPDSSVSPQ